MEERLLESCSARIYLSSEAQAAASVLAEKLRCTYYDETAAVTMCSLSSYTVLYSLTLHIH